MNFFNEAKNNLFHEGNTFNIMYQTLNVQLVKIHLIESKSVIYKIQFQS